MTRETIITPLPKLGRNKSGGKQARFSQALVYKRAGLILHVSDPNLVAWARQRGLEARHYRAAGAHYDLNSARVITPPWQAWPTKTSIMKRRVGP